MPRLNKAVPKYQRHRASGQAVVTLSGRDFYLGPHGTKASKIEYDRIVAEWLQNGRQLPTAADGAITIVELIAAYLRFAKKYYRKGNEQTSEYAGIIAAVRPLKRLYATTSVDEFGPLRLQTVRQQLVDDGYSRGSVNQMVGRIRRMFKWAAGEELIPAGIPQALTMVSGLRRGRTEARETAPVLPIGDVVVDATLPYLPDVVADMVRLQRLTGMRPAEVCRVRPCDIDRNDEVWTFTPATHKTEHHERQRLVFLGPKAQEVLLRYLARGADDYCFRPSDSEQKRRAAQHAARKTPLSCGNSPGTNKRRKPKRPAGDQYTSASYARAIARACEKQFPHPTISGIRAKDRTPEQKEELKEWNRKHRWAPNRLRHSAATEVRREFGLEAAQVVLGHSKADVTQIYAERDIAKGREVARQIG